MDTEGETKIKEFSFEVDVNDCSKSIFDHIFANLKRSKDDYEVFFYLDKKMIKKIEFDDVCLFSMGKLKHVLFIVETKPPKIIEDFNYSLEDSANFTFVVLFKNQVKNVE